MSGNGRWKFHDPEGTLDDYTFPVNPNQQDPADVILFNDTPIPTQEGAQGVLTAIQGPQQWTFSGTSLSQEQIDEFQIWIDNGRNVEITDHYDQTWLVQLTDISTMTRKLAHRSSARINWVVQALMIGKVSCSVLNNSSPNPGY